MADTANDLLQATARSFYLTLRVLPGPVRTQIGLAYLLARTTDTIADTEIVPPGLRIQALHDLRERILDATTQPLHFGELARGQGSAAERLLLERVEESLAALRLLSADDQKLVKSVLLTIISGQELDLRRFAIGTEASTEVPPPALSPAPSASQPGAALTAGPETTGSRRKKIIALQTATELDDYTYRVAGCVGEFWTHLCRAHLFPRARLDDHQLVADGVRFGQGLQLVNILRDLPADLANGRCYLPLAKLRPAGLEPEALLAPENEAVFLPLYQAALDQATAHLEAGWRYTNTLPFGQFRVRLACAWPVLLGFKTIARLRTAGVADLQRRVKVPRRKVYAMMAWSTLASPVPFLWHRLAAAASRG